jgi:hypothetical protein
MGKQCDHEHFIPDILTHLQVFSTAKHKGGVNCRLPFCIPVWLIVRAPRYCLSG